MSATKPKRLVVAINPTASFGKGRDVGPAVVQTLRALGHDVTSLQEPDFEQLMAAGRKAVAGKPDALIVVGGDGMVNLGTNLVVGTKVPLGLVPSGTGNDMARGLGIPHQNTEAAIETYGFSQLYLQLGEPLDDTHVVRIWHKPYITLIWLGAILMALAGVISLTDRRMRVGAPRRAKKPAPQAAQ